MNSWSVSDVLAVFLVLAFVIGVVLMLSVVSKSDEKVECDRANTIRAQLILLAAFVLGALTLVSQRYELASSVKHLMA